jgi:hypothetical protein
VLCPMGKVLYPGSYTRRTKVVAFYNYEACRACVCRCTKSRFKRFAIVMREEDFSRVYNSEGLFVRRFGVKADRGFVGLRKCLCEHPFGSLKRGFGMGYCLLRGIERVRGEFSLSFLVYNLRRVLNIVGVSRLLQAIQP